MHAFLPIYFRGDTSKTALIDKRNQPKQYGSLQNLRSVTNVSGSVASALAVSKSQCGCSIVVSREVDCSDEDEKACLMEEGKDGVASIAEVELECAKLSRKESQKAWQIKRAERLVTPKQHSLLPEPAPEPPRVLESPADDTADNFHVEMVHPYRNRSFYLKACCCFSATVITTAAALTTLRYLYPDTN